MIRYKKYQMTGENSPLKGLWYARPVIEETYDTERLAKHMANHFTLAIQFIHQLRLEQLFHNQQMILHQLYTFIPS